MKNVIYDPTKMLTFTVPLTAKFYRQAERFQAQQSNPEKAQQVYQNTLAVLAVNFYCQCLGIETDLENSESWNPVMQTLSNTGTLSLKNLGNLECRPVLPDTEWVEIPIEVSQNRLGYIIVELDESQQQATLLGFIKEPNSEKIPFDQLLSLEVFINELDEIQSPVIPKLTDWLNGVLTLGWQTVETLQESLGNPPALAFRSPKFRGKNRIEHGKTLEVDTEGHKINLIVGISPTLSSEMDISVEVYPENLPSRLPGNLELMILDEEGKAVMQAVASQTESLEFEFTGEPGEQFSVKVMIGDVSVTQPFWV